MKRVKKVCQQCQYFHHSFELSYCILYEKNIGNDMGGFKPHIDLLPEKFEDRLVPDKCKYSFEHKIIGQNKISRFTNWLKKIFR